MSASEPLLLETLLGQCIKMGASDLHLASESPPYFRVQGDLAPAGIGPVAKKTVRSLARSLLGSRVADLDSPGSIDGACSAQDGTRFRYNIYRSRGMISIALRRLEDRFYSLSELGLPDQLYELADLPDGLIVVAGPTGSGKSTTLATLIDRINQSRTGHVVTIEDPVEYIHRSSKCLVNQREIGIDAASFHESLVAAMRQDPDVILVGEIRDLNTIRTAITASETGHLVFTTVHAGDCVGAIERMVSVFPSDEQDGIRRQLSLVLRAIIAQHLLMREARAGERRKRVVTSEVLRITPAVAHLIAAGKSNHIYSSMETGRGQGMQTLEQDLARLWVEGAISETAAVAIARNPNVMRDRAAQLRRSTVRVTRRRR